MKTDMETIKIAVLGAGNIGSAVTRGLAVHKHASVTLWNRSQKRLDKFGNCNGTVTTCDLKAAVTGAKYIFICVEGPAVIPVLDDCVRYVVPEETIIVSCAASVTLAQLREAAPDFAIARLLPNIAAAIGESANLFCSSLMTPEQEKELIELCKASGPVLELPEEQFAVGMVLSSCGIAYAARYIRACMSGGVALGLTASQAARLAAEALRGTAALLEADGAHPEQLIDSVCTPGGVTVAGLNAMEERGFSPAIVHGMLTAAKKV
ncbi:MAG: NAD(P)-binding domain-containing protein [Muribaculaceae bacterium]|nr:NAD(P)-binding domain-containing protein [Muribaculaceae bacterium]